MRTKEIEVSSDFIVEFAEAWRNMNYQMELTE